MTNKKQYIKPELVVHGSVKDLTQAGTYMGTTDASFPNQTPFAQLTFSPLP